MEKKNNRSKDGRNPQVKQNFETFDDDDDDEINDMASRINPALQLEVNKLNGEEDMDEDDPEVSGGAGINEGGNGGHVKKLAFVQEQQKKKKTLLLIPSTCN